MASWRFYLLGVIMKFILDMPPVIKVDDVFEQLECIPDRIPLVGEINEELAATVRATIEMAQFNMDKTKQEIIPIIIDTYGGDAYAMMSIIDAIDNCPYPVATIIEGKAMSAGAVIASCGARGYRYMAPNATIMLHHVRLYTAGGSPEDLEVDAQELRRLHDIAMERIAKNCKKKKNFFTKKLREGGDADLYLSAKEALEIGLIDHIGLPMMKTTISITQEFGMDLEQWRPRKKR